MSFITVNGLLLHYRDEGRQDESNVNHPPLVFINSLGTDLRIWDAVVPHFATEQRIIRYDKRGHGLSDCPAPPYTIRQHMQDLVGLLDALPVEEVILVGISVGGMIALDFAAQHPARVQRLILCDTAPKIGTSEMWNQRIETLRTKGMTHLAETILSRWFVPRFATKQPSAYRGYYNMLTRMPVDGYTGTCQAIRDTDLWADTAKVQVPTLLLCGEEDLATPPQVTIQLAEAMPNATYRIIADAAHLPCIEQPAAMAAEIVRFLERRA